MQKIVAKSHEQRRADGPGERGGMTPGPCAKANRDASASSDARWQRICAEARHDLAIHFPPGAVDRFAGTCPLRICPASPSPPPRSPADRAEPAPGYGYLRRDGSRRGGRQRFPSRLRRLHEGAAGATFRRPARTGAAALGGPSRRDPVPPGRRGRDRLPRLARRDGEHRRGRGGAAPPPASPRRPRDGSNAVGLPPRARANQGFPAGRGGENRFSAHRGNAGPPRLGGCLHPDPKRTGRRLRSGEAGIVAMLGDRSR